MDVLRSEALSERIPTGLRRGGNLTVDRDEADGYWQVLEPYWARIDIYNGPEAFLATYGEVPPVVQILFAAHWCESEVSNGGLHQFFMNPTGVLAPEAAQAFRKLGFPD